MTENSTGETFPLYDEVKKNIYKLYQELKKASTLCLTATKYDYHTSYIIFVEKYLNFYQEVCHDNKLKNIDKSQKVYLKKAYKHLILKKKLNRKQISKVSIYSRNVVEALGITKIEMKQQDTWGI